MNNEVEPKSANEQANSDLRRNDLIVAVLLWIVSCIWFAESLSMTFNINLPLAPQKAWLVAPGLFPMLLSGGLLIMLSGLIWFSYKHGSFREHFTFTVLLEKITEKERVTKILQISLLCTYVLVLLGNLHFGVASAFYLIGAMVLSRAAKFYQIVIIAIIFSVIITYTFGSVMKVPLP